MIPWKNYREINADCEYQEEIKSRLSEDRESLSAQLNSIYWSVFFSSSW